MLKTAIDEFKIQAENWTDTVKVTDFSNPMTARMLNDQMIQLEKIFLAPNGLPRDKLTKNVLIKGGLKYGKAIFPGIINLLNELHENIEDKPINDLIEQWDGWELLKRHITELYVMIIQATSHLKPFHLI